MNKPPYAPSTAMGGAGIASMSFGSPNDPCQGHSPLEPQMAEINRTVRFILISYQKGVLPCGQDRTISAYG